MLEGLNKFKNYRIIWFFRPLRLAKFESLWIQVCSLVTILGYRVVFPSFFLLSLNFNGVFSMILRWFTIVEHPSLLATSPFYSVILRFSGYHWFPPFVPLDTRLNVVSATLVAGPFLIPHYLLLFGASSSKVSCCLSVLICLKELTLGFSLFKVSSSHLFRLSFWQPFPLLFFLKWVDSFLLGWKFPSHFPSWFFFYGFPKVPAPYSWIVSSQAF